LLYEARLAQDWCEYRRALDFYERALAAAPEDVPSSAIADILESVRRLRDAIRDCAQRVAGLRVVVAVAPQDPEARIGLGCSLTSLGRGEEAIQHFRAALPFLETLQPCCRVDCLHKTGWYHYRRSEYREALTWFERAAKVEPSDNLIAAVGVQGALRSKIRVYSKLGMQREARQEAEEYVAQYGRLPGPERDALQKLNIDADAMYVEHCTGPLL
jgi:tetratricopeptide (TPR) repeat protein